MENINACKQCGLPNYKLSYGRKDLEIDNDGICQFCNDFNTAGKTYNINYDTNKKKLLRLVDKIRGKNEYDAVVMFTGGKDSGYTAHILSKELNLKVLALTWDNGFFSQEHKDNIKRLVKNIGVDHKFISIGDDYLSEFYKNRFTKLGRFCACTQPSLFFCAPEIEKYGASIISMGVSFGQQLALVQNRLLFEFDNDSRDIIKDMIFKEGFGVTKFRDPGYLIGSLLDVISGEYSDGMIDLLRKCTESMVKMQKADFHIVLMSLCYDFDYNDMLRVMQSYNWKKPQGTHDAGHTSCIMEPLKGHLCYQQGMLNLDYQEMSAERRWGRLDATEFNSLEKHLHYSSELPDTINEFFRVTGITQKEFDEVLKQKPFAQKNAPKINWELARKLPHGFSDELLEENINLAFNRAIP